VTAVAPEGAAEESPDTEGQDAPAVLALTAKEAAKADGQWHRKETASGDMISPETPEVRVKRWGKSPPAPW